MNIRELLDKLETIEESHLLELTDQEKADLDRAKSLNNKADSSKTGPAPKVEPVPKAEPVPVPVPKAEPVPVPVPKAEPEVKKSDEVEEPELVNQLDWIGMGARGPEVEALQKRLKQEGFNLGAFGPNKDGIDGQFGNTTRQALIQFQQKLVDANKMPAKLADGKPSVDGYFGPVTAKAAGMPWPSVKESIELNIANKLLESFGYVAETDYTDYVWKQAKQDASSIGDWAKDTYNWATSGHAGGDIKQAAGSAVDAVKSGAHGVAKDFRKFVDQPAGTQAKQIANNIQSGWAKYGTTLKDSPEALDAFVRGLANGITFGLADNVAAEVTALTSNVTYGKALQAELEKTKRYKETHPYATTMGEFTGPLAVYKNLAMQLVVPELAKRYVTDPMNKSSMDKLHRQEADALLKEADDSAMIADGVNALQSALSRIVPGVQVTGTLSPQDIKAIKLARTKLGVGSDAEVLLKLLGGTTNESVKLSESEQISRLKTILQQLDEVGGRIGAVDAVLDLAKLGLKAESEAAAKEIVYAAGKSVGKEGLALALQEIGKTGVKIPVPKGTQLQLNGITFKSDPKSGNWFKRGGEQDTWIPVSAKDNKMIELGQTWKASEVSYGEWYNLADTDLKITIEELGKKSVAYTSGKAGATAVSSADGVRNDLIDWRGDKKTNPNYGKPAIGIKPGSIEEKDILKAAREREAAIKGKQGQEQNVVTRYHDVPPGSKLSNYHGRDYFKDPLDNKWKYKVKTSSGKEVWQAEKDLTTATDIEAEFNRRVAAGDASAWKNPNATSAGQGRTRQELTGKYPTAGAIGRGLQALGRVTTPAAKALWEAAQNNPKVAAVIGAIALLAGGLYVWGGTGNIEGGKAEQETPASLTPDEVDELENFVKKYGSRTDDNELMAEVARSRETLKKNGIPGY